MKLSRSFWTIASWKRPCVKLRSSGSAPRRKKAPTGQSEQRLFSRRLPGILLTTLIVTRGAKIREEGKRAKKQVLSKEPAWLDDDEDASSFFANDRPAAIQDDDDTPVDSIAGSETPKPAPAPRKRKTELGEDGQPKPKRKRRTKAEMEAARAAGGK